MWCCRARSSCERRICGCGSTSRSPPPSSPTGATPTCWPKPAGMDRRSGGRASWTGRRPRRTTCRPPPTSVPLDPCLITFTSGTAGEPKAVLHGQRYLDGQQLQAEHWLAARPGDLVWCTAASGWSKSARNVFIAPWLRGATALLHDARFDPAERLDILERERVAVLCMAPTEYRVIAKRVELRRFPRLRALVAAGEALNPEVLEVWRERDRPGDPRRLRPDRDRPADRQPRRRARTAGSMGRALPGREAVDRGRRAGRRPRDGPDVLPEVLGRRRADPASRPWRTGDRVIQDDDGYLFFEGRTDDVIISAGYRIGPFEVESALVAHPAVAEAAVVAAPDEERGAVVRAIVVLRDGHARATSSLARSRTTSRPRPRPTSTRASSSSPTTCRRRRAARSAARCCAVTKAVALLLRGLAPQTERQQRHRHDTPRDGLEPSPRSVMPSSRSS